MTQKVCKICANLETIRQNVLKTYYEEKKLISFKLERWAWYKGGTKTPGHGT